MSAQPDRDPPPKRSETTDEIDFQEVLRLSEEKYNGAKPGRDAVMARLGCGTKKAKRLRQLWDKRDGRDLTPIVKTDSTPTDPTPGVENHDPRADRPKPDEDPTPSTPSAESQPTPDSDPGDGTDSTHRVDNADPLGPTPGVENILTTPDQGSDNADPLDPPRGSTPSTPGVETPDPEGSSTADHPAGVEPTPRVETNPTPGVGQGVEHDPTPRVETPDHSLSTPRVGTGADPLDPHDPTPHEDGAETTPTPQGSTTPTETDPTPQKLAADPQGPTASHTGGRVGLAMANLVNKVADRVDRGSQTTDQDPTPEPPPTDQAGLRWFYVAALLAIAAPAFVAVWSGWLGLASKTGWTGKNLLPGLVAEGGWATVDTSILLGVGVEVYGALALAVFLSHRNVKGTLRTYSAVSAFTSLAVGAAGQVAYHVMVVLGIPQAGAVLTGFVSVLPVGTLGAAAALLHLVAAQRKNQ